MLWGCQPPPGSTGLLLTSLAPWTGPWLSLFSCDSLAQERSSTPVRTSYWAEELCPLGNSFPNPWCSALKIALQAPWDLLLCRNWRGPWEWQYVRDAGGFPPPLSLLICFYDSVVWLSKAGRSRRSRTFWPQVPQSAWVIFGPLFFFLKCHFLAPSCQGGRGGKLGTFVQLWKIYIHFPYLGSLWQPTWVYREGWLIQCPKFLT